MSDYRMTLARLVIHVRLHLIQGMYKAYINVNSLKSAIPEKAYTSVARLYADCGWSIKHND